MAMRSVMWVSASPSSRRGRLGAGTVLIGFSYAA
jgi:hypothetical protein